MAFIGADGSFLSHKLFAYCLHNPANLSDTAGNWPMGKDVAAVTAAAGGAGAALACALLRIV